MSPQPDRKVDAPLITSRNDVLEVLEVMQSFVAREWAKGPAEVIDGLIEPVRLELVKSSQATRTVYHWARLFGELGAAAMAIVVQRVGSFDNSAMAELLLKKSQNYGPTPIRAWGPVGVVIRISSKFERYKNLVNREKEATLYDEPLDDTLKDIIGYCVLGVRLVTE